jgi:hypothetical protein
MTKITCMLLCCAMLSTAAVSKSKDASSSVSSFVSKKYGIKSGVITMTLEMSAGQMPAGAPTAMASNGTITQTFDEFGAKESFVNETAMEMMGMKINTKSQIIIRDGFVYVVDSEKKQATKSKVLKIDDPAKLDFMSKDAEYIKRWNIKKEGTEEVAGKPCDIYSFKTDDIQTASGVDSKGKNKMPMEGKCWVWNNIGLKADFILNGSMTMKTLATKVDEKAAIGSTSFDIPAGYKIKEAKE